MCHCNVDEFSGKTADILDWRAPVQQTAYPMPAGCSRSTTHCEQPFVCSAFSPCSPTGQRPRPVRVCPGTPPAVAGRQHGDCQTAILEALAFPPEGVASTQTEADPPAPLQRLREAPDGEDASTQVSPEDLFDFERDAAPAVRDLVAAALQEVELEAGEGLRLDALRRRRRQLEEVRTGPWGPVGQCK